jgi:6,7-dimethyl-8-ribityllumazine synthase
MNIAIVVSDFNEEITSRMLQVARERASLLGLGVVHVSHVPGAYDMPLVVDHLLRNPGIDAVATLGAIIRGQTKHDEAIAQAVSRALSDLSLKHQKPVSLGITGPGMTERQAYARIRPVAERSVETAAKVSQEIERIKARGDLVPEDGR